ncbi:MAG: alcohol dehydrogenase [Mycobacterium sp.]|nr:alcohol dehydrogenase [Mycobacterium sp.]
MKAWQFVGDRMPLTRNDVAEPVLREGWVIVRVMGTGLCHTDVAFLDGDIPSSFMRHVPMTIGHEVAGVAVAVGEGVIGVAVGDRVGVRSGPDGAGWAYHGGFAELMAAPAEHVVKAPEHIPFSHLAVGGDAGMVAHHAVAQRGGAAPGVRMGIIGLGGLGCSGLQIAAMLGASVYAAEPRTELYERASTWGAIEVFSDAKHFAGLELDVIVDFAGFSSTVAAAVATVGFEGTVILVGAGDAASTIDTMLLVKNKIHLAGHHGADGDDLRAYWDFLSRGLDPVVTEISFDDIGEGIERLRRREVIGRLVAVLDDDDDG